MDNSCDDNNIMTDNKQINENLFNNKVELDNNLLIFECPNCHLVITVLQNEVNCKIFRHAIYKNNLQQINPHAPKIECDKLVEEDRIIGCCRPFRLNDINNIWTVEECGYI